MEHTEVDTPEVNIQENQAPPSQPSDPSQNENPPSSGNQKKKIAIVVPIVLFIVVVGVILVAVFGGSRAGRITVTPKPESESSVIGERKVCTSPHCTAIASALKAGMNPAVDPCEDFHQYSCGKWGRRPSSFEFVKEDLLVTLRDLLEKPIEDTDIDAIKKSKKVYQACRDKTALDELGTGPLLNLLRELGGWPIISESWSEANFNLTTLLAKVKLLSVDSPINYIVEPDILNPETKFIHLVQNPLGLRLEKYLEGRQGKSLVDYENFTIYMALELNAKKDVAKQDVNEMIEFEIKLAKISPREIGFDFSTQYKITKIKDVGAKLPNSVDWVRYFVAIFQSANMKIDENEEIIVHHPDYIKEVEKILNEASRRTLANYILWHVTLRYIEFLPRRFGEMSRKLKKELETPIKSYETWQDCTEWTLSVFEMAVGRMLFEKRLGKEAMSSVTRMISTIRESFKKKIQEVDWMKNVTKKSTQGKVDAMEVNIGSPDYILDDEALNKDYKDIDVDPKRFFDNAVAISRLQIASLLASLRVPLNRKRWPAGPATVNAFYLPEVNSIFFPAGILAAPMYHPESPMSMNYGAIGMIMGHEIIHGFDNTGRHYDKDGSASIWWEDEDIAEFNKRAGCIEEQYDNYTTSTHEISGTLSMGENIADNGGLKAAYRAYKKWADSNDPEPSLPEIDFTDEQLFFIHFAQIWCKAEEDPPVVKREYTRHCPGMIRIIGSVSNSPEFAKVFNCTPGSNMNPVKKCILW